MIRESAVSEIDMKKVEDVVLSVSLPGDVSSFDLRFSEDSTGVPAVWVNFHICEDNKPSAKRLRGSSRSKKMFRERFLMLALIFGPTSGW